MYKAMNGLCVAVVAKSGSQSIRACGAGWDVSNETVMLYPRRLFFIRHPLKRLKSAYGFFKTLKAQKSIYSKFDIGTKTWQEFVDHVLSGAKDEHWTPQVESLFFQGEFTPTEVLRFEDINKWWPLYFPTELKRLNASIPQQTPDYRLKELKQYYAADLSEWNNARVFDGVEGVKKWP